jgi:hypothetical protein
MLYPGGGGNFSFPNFLSPQIQLPGAASGSSATQLLAAAKEGRALVNKAQNTTIHTWEYSSDHVGDYDIPSRTARLERYQTKRKELTFRKVRYAARSEICLQRKRVGGRFVTSTEEKDALTTSSTTPPPRINTTTNINKRTKRVSEDEEVSETGTSDEEVFRILSHMKHVVQ